MNQKPLISVIVPVYNVEPYLDECINSIVSQTYNNLQIILVDDGSTDNSGKLCDEWAEKDDRITVIHKENGGLSDARNFGLDASEGDLVGFIDSDDYIRSDMYELLLNNMIENDSDISACGIELFWEDGTPSRMLTKSGSFVFNTEEAMKAVFKESYLIQPVVYKLYKKDLIKDIKFPVGKYHEDVYWTYKAIAQAKSVSVFDEPCYLYRQRCGSIMNSNYSLKRLDSIAAQYERLKFIESDFPRLGAMARVSMWFSCIYTTQMLIKYANSDDRKKGIVYVKQILKTHPIKLNEAKGLPLKQYIWLFIAKISLKLVCSIRNALGIGF